MSAQAQQVASNWSRQSGEMRQILDVSRWDFILFADVLKLQIILRVVSELVKVGDNAGIQTLKKSGKFTEFEDLMKAGIWCCENNYREYFPIARWLFEVNRVQLFQPLVQKHEVCWWKRRTTQPFIITSYAVENSLSLRT